MTPSYKTFAVFYFLFFKFMIMHDYNLASGTCALTGFMMVRIEECI